MIQLRLVELLLAAAEGAPEGLAPGAGDPQPGPSMDLTSFLFPMVAIFFIFWLLVFRPESRKRKAREQMITAVKKGDTVLTTGGIRGKVWRVDGNDVVVLVDKDKDIKLTFAKSAVFEVNPPEDPNKGKDSGHAGR